MKLRISGTRASLIRVFQKRFQDIVSSLGKENIAPYRAIGYIHIATNVKAVKNHFTNKKK